jgi:phage recombination protein Bet
MARSTALATTQAGPNALALSTGYTEEQIAILKSTVAKELETDEEIAFFITYAAARGLDPFGKQIYAFKSKGRVSIGATIDGMRAIADDTGLYAGNSVECECDDKGYPISATAVIEKWNEKMQRVVKFPATVDMKEFKGNTPIWGIMPKTMLKKCAEAHALRKAFPQKLGNVYETAERDSIDVTSHGSATVVSNNKGGRALQNLQRLTPKPAQKQPQEEQGGAADDEEVWFRTKQELWGCAMELYGNDKDAKKEIDRIADENGWSPATFTTEQMSTIIDKLMVAIEAKESKENPDG